MKYIICIDRYWYVDKSEILNLLNFIKTNFKIDLLEDGFIDVSEKPMDYSIFLTKDNVKYHFYELKKMKTEEQEKIGYNRYSSALLIKIKDYLNEI